jgi:transcriptional regulator with GAF, ATPase, and Fis domain
MVDRFSKAERNVGTARAAVTGRQWQELPESVKYGDVCYEAERYGDALDAYSRVLDAVPSGKLAPDVRARLHYRIACCYIRRGNYHLALEHLDNARQALPRHLDKARLAKIYARRGQIMVEMGRYDRAQRYLGWARKLLNGTNEHEELAGIEMQLGMVAARVGRSREARQCFLGALTTYRRIKSASGEARALNNLGLQYKNACEWREAVRYLEEARTLFHRLGDRHRLCIAHKNLGIVHWKLGKWDLCEENLGTAEKIARELNETLLLVRTQLAQGNLALRRRQWDAAVALYTAARETAGKESYGREAILAEEFMGELELDRGNPDAAAAILETCLAEAERLAPEGDLVTEALRRFAEVRLAQGRHQEALGLAKRAASMASRDGDRYEESVALRTVGLAMMELGDPEQGERVVEMSLGSLSEISESFQKGRTHFAYGDYLARRAGRNRSRSDLERAGLQFQRAYGAFLDLDARVHAAEAAYQRASLEARFQRFEEAATYRAKARQILPPDADPELDKQIDQLGAALEDAFAERWSSGDDVLTSLREMKRLFQGASDTDAVLRELIRLAVTRSGSDRGLVAHAGSNGRVRVAAVFGFDETDATAFLEVLKPVTEVALDENRAMWSNNASEDERFAALARDVRFQTQSLVLLPLVLTEDRSGLLLVDKVRDNIEGAYHQGEVHLLTILANLAALSIMERSNTRLKQENLALRAKVLDAGDDRFVTENAELKKTLGLVTKVANSPVSILVEGETGTGKGLLAQIIHESSDRKDKPFVQINCAALPEPLLESELFGHVKGAFTGASYNKTGLFKEAEQGTLFLDEVDKTSLAVQAKLLHVMDSKEVRPVGSVKSYRVDTRVICATNSDLRSRIQHGEFLEDLYYRLNDFIVRVPPLRERREDILPLIEYFLRKFSKQYGRPEVRLGSDVVRILIEQQWRGNVRELEKTIRRLVVLADEEMPVGPELLPVEIQVSEAPPSADTTLREEVARTERRVIGEALRAANWNKAQVARTLKVSYPCLLKKIKDHGLVRPR